MFNKLKTYGALEYCFRNHPNETEAILHFMCIAYNSMQLFIFKGVSSEEVKKFTQNEIVRLLEKELYRMRYSIQYSVHTT